MGKLRIIHNDELKLRSLYGKKPILIIISGTSESGKSTFSLRLLNEGISSRIKILALVKTLMKENAIPRCFDETGSLDPDGMLRIAEKKNCRRVFATITDRLFELIKNQRVVTIESIKQYRLYQYIRSDNRFCAFSIFIDAKFGLRIKREALRIGGSYVKLYIMIKRKDAEKANLGNLIIKEKADVILFNNGSSNAFHKWISAFGHSLVIDSIYDFDQLFEVK